MSKRTSSTRKKKFMEQKISNSSIHSDSPIIKTAANHSRIYKPKKKKALKEGDMFKERTVSAKTFSRWKPISKSSQALLVQTIDSAIVSVLSKTSSVAYDDVQGVLNSLKKRVLDKAWNLKAPVTKRPNFNTLEAACRKIESEALEASNQEELLSEMVEQMTRTVHEKEEILEKLDKGSNEARKEKS